MKKLLPKLLGYRAVNGFSFLFICVILAIAGYAQIHYQLEPCPLCVMQRILLAILGLLFIFGFLYVGGKRSRQILHSIIFIFALLGIAIASRHIYLQHLPPELAPSCGPGLNFIVKNLSPGEALRMILMGSGECSKIEWHFLGLTIPEWSLICFILLSVAAIIQFFRDKV
jgi:disulfide bond formation protein DsbB